MFDIGFIEMLVIGIVALIVIGPERLPGVARSAGKYFGRLKRFVTTVRTDVEHELRADELRDILAKQQEELNSLKDTVTDVGKDVEEQFSQTVNDLHPDVVDVDEPKSAETDERKGENESLSEFDSFYPASTETNSSEAKTSKAKATKATKETKSKASTQKTPAQERSKTSGRKKAVGQKKSATKNKISSKTKTSGDATS